jgi:hypothetical protein
MAVFISQDSELDEWAIIPERLHEATGPIFSFQDCRGFCDKWRAPTASRRLFLKFLSEIAAMENTVRPHRFWRPMTALMIVLAILVSFLNGGEKHAENYLDRSLKRALGTFALARGLNGVISVAQKVQISLSPAGMGMNVAPAEVLDPIDDLVEQFSEIMLVSSSALIAQKILLAILSSGYFTLVFALVGILAIGAMYFDTERGAWRPRILRLAFGLAFARFFLPVSIYLNGFLYSHFLEERFAHAERSVTTTKGQLEEVTRDSITNPAVVKGDEESSFWGRIQSFGTSILSPFQSLKSAIEDKVNGVLESLDNLATNLIELIVVFLMETIILPLCFLWGALFLTRSLLIRRFEPRSGRQAGGLQG